MALLNSLKFAQNGFHYMNNILNAISFRIYLLFLIHISKNYVVKDAIHHRKNMMQIALVPNKQLSYYLNQWTHGQSIDAYICFTSLSVFHGNDDIIKWKHFPRYWPFVRGIHQSPVNSPHKGQWRRALTFSYLHPNKRLSKQWWGWWFETPSCPLWRHRNGCNAWVIFVVVTLCNGVVTCLVPCLNIT